MSCCLSLVSVDCYCQVPVLLAALFCLTATALIRCFYVCELTPLLKAPTSEPGFFRYALIVCLTRQVQAILFLLFIPVSLR